MATEINTFSAAVATCMRRGGHPDKLLDIVGYIRLTMRECQMLQTFDADMIEETVVATTDPYVWEKPGGFRHFLAVQYPGLADPQGNIIYAKETKPGPSLNNVRYHYYMTGQGTSIVFGGHGAAANASQNINIAYYKYMSALSYFAADVQAPARYFLETEAWEYEPAATTAELQEAARNKVTNWILFNWYDVVLEGALAKLYKVVGDQRAPAAFGLYKQLQKDLGQGAGQLTSSHNA